MSARLSECWVFIEEVIRSDVNENIINNFDHVESDYVFDSDDVDSDDVDSNDDDVHSDVYPDDLDVEEFSKRDVPLNADSTEISHFDTFAEQVEIVWQEG